MIDDQYVQRKVEKDFADFYPANEDMHAQISGRRSRGKLFFWVFLVATMVAIIALLTLLVTIINQSFGLVAEQVVVPEETLVTDFNKTRVTNATNVVESGEDDQALAEGIAADPYGAGFFGHAFYTENQETLHALSIGGVAPTEENVLSGQYPGTRPLFIYSAAEILEEKPQVAAFLAYYLQNLEVVSEIGYFAADEEALAQQQEAIFEALGVDELPQINPADYEGDISVSGSSTVFPVTTAMAEKFKEDGFKGEIQVESTGTGGGFSAFCTGSEGIDIVDASRHVDTIEFEACRGAGLDLNEYLIGQDAVVAVVSNQNDFVTDVSREDAESLFTDAVTWADVNESWPAENITRHIPTADSGTMDFFVRSLFDEQTLLDLPYYALVDIYSSNVTIGRCRAVEREKRFYLDQLVCDSPEAFATACAGDNPPGGCTEETRTHDDLELMIAAEIIQPTVLESWFLYPSIFNRQEIALEAATKYPNAHLKFKSWLSWDFITSPQSSQPEIAGVRTAILGSLWVVFIAILVAFPLGVAAALYLEEYADPRKRFNQVIQTNINNLAGVPSIIYGMLGLAVFVRFLEPITSGAVFGAVEAGTTANGRTVLSAGLTLGLLGLPIVIIAAQEAIKAVPPSLREASMGLGATKWQTIWNHVLPNAIPGILTGTILTMSRVIGETAPLVVVGASTFITSDPTSPFSKFTTLPAQVYQWTTRPQDTFRNIAGAAIIVLLILLLALNAAAIYLRNHFSKRFA
ncbi:MAG: phosphate ABC transporter permease PstA [Candidatus Promineifilaceae bacterium]